MKDYSLFLKGWFHFWNWVKALFSSSDDASIKRFIGALIMICLLILSFLVAKGKIELATWDKIEDWLRVLLYCSTGLLGIGAVIDGAKIIKNYSPISGSQPTKIEETEKQLDLPTPEKPVI